MTTPELINYIKSQTEKSTPKDIIVSKLISSGWKVEDINEVFSKITATDNSEIKNQSTQAGMPLDPYRESLNPESEVHKTQTYVPVEEKVEVPEMWPITKKQEFDLCF